MADPLNLLFSFLAGDGRLYTVNYVADEKGYRAQGSHVPWPPVINTVKDQPQVLLVDAGKDVVEMPKDPVKTVKMEPESVKKGDDKNSVDIQIIKTQNDSITNEGFAIMEVIPATGGATEKLTIHVPLISKVYSLLKPSKLAGKGMRKDGKSSRIIRYKLAYQPSYGGNVLTPIMD